MTRLTFDGRVAIVTGGGRGIGRANAECLANRGAAVLVNDLGVPVEGGRCDESVAQEVAVAIAKNGGIAVADSHDVSTVDGAHAVVDHAVRSFGRLDIIVNNAGIVQRRPFAEFTSEDLCTMMAVHLGGHFNLTQAGWRRLLQQGYGRVVMTASSAALFGTSSNATYGAAKGAIIGLTRSLSKEADGTGVTVNAILPGAYTRMAEFGMASRDPAHLSLLRKAMPPERVAPVVAWLCHETCHVNGEVLNVRGGAVCAVFFGQTHGILDQTLSIETVAERIGEVLSKEGFSVPETTEESSELALRISGTA
jgi:NAD(P)-dependent dehydrogenase (short-subunit alcohol dehydrogenase family)